MKVLTSLVLASILGIGFLQMGCEVSHTETDKQGLLGDKHEETTVTKNPVTGDTSVTHSSQTTP